MTSLPRGLHLTALLSLFGCLVFRRFVAPASERLPMVRWVGGVSAWLAVISGGVWLTVVSGSMAGTVSVIAALDVVPEVVRHTSFGHAVGTRLLLLTAVLALLPWRSQWAELAALLAAGAAVALQPLLGHAGALEDGARTVLIPIEATHLLAAGAWVGALFPLLLCVLRERPPLAAVLCERFTPVGLISVGTIAITALPQAGELIGGLGGLFGTQYGHMALVKLGLFALALGLACVNRLVLTTRPGTAARPRARPWLIGSIAIEALAVICVVLVAGAMASAPPAEHVQPVWPFAWRPSLDAWEEPELRAELLRLVIAAGGALILVAAGLAVRRFRLLAVALAAIVVAPFASSLDLLLVEAYPTSYARSTTGFSVDAIARGRILFADRCAVCHEPQTGTGSGADLTAPHLWGHLDGELFWWITNGVVDPEGAALMPGFGSVLSEDDRWGLIDFVRARNIGRQAADTGKWTPPVPAPAMPLSCAGTDAGALSDLAGKGLLVAAGDGPHIPGLVTIRLTREGTHAPKAGECIAAAASAWDAWAVLAGVPADRLTGKRAIVDGQGWLRAWLPPEASADQVQTAIRDARDHPIAAGARPETGHHH